MAVRTTTVSVSLIKSQSVQAMLGEIHGVICEMQSEAWDLLSEQTRDDAGAALQALDRLMEMGEVV